MSITGKRIFTAMDEGEENDTVFDGNSSPESLKRVDMDAIDMTPEGNTDIDASPQYYR